MELLYASIKETAKAIITAMAAEGIDPTDLELYQFGAPLRDIRIVIPPLPDTPDPFDPSNDAYDKFADEALGLLKEAFAADDRGHFLDIAYAWAEEQRTYEEMIKARRVVSPKEWAAYQASVDKVKAYLFGNDGQAAILDLDMWFKDSPVPPDLRRKIDKDLAKVDIATSRILSRALRQMKGRAVARHNLGLFHTLSLNADSVRQNEGIFQTLSIYADSVIFAIKENSLSKAKLQQMASSFAEVVIKESPCLLANPAAGDAGDLCQFRTGKDMCTGEDLNEWGRALSGAAVFIGSSKPLRMIAESAGVETKVASAALKTEKIVDSAKNIRSKMSNLGDVSPGTSIPKYFRLQTEGAEFFVNPNATKHMGEYINSLSATHGSPLRNDLIISSFESGVKEAVKSGAWKTSLDTGKPIISGGWELIFSKRATDELPVIMHALMKK